MSSATGTTQSVMVVDDNHFSRDSLCELLAELGCSTRATDRGLRALAMLHDDRGDLVVSDVDMPDISGFELLARMQQQLSPTPPMLLVSARADEALGQAARDAGAAGLMAKPVPIGQFTTLVHRLLGL